MQAAETKPKFKLERHEFEGPLDLLLSLIEEEKLPINEVALAEVTEQFLQYLRSLSEARPEILADFLTVAGRLLVIKSKSLLPTLQLEQEDEEDVGLAKQLMLLKKYREAANRIKDIESRQKQSFTREPFLGEQVIFYPDPSVSIDTLNKAAKKIVSVLEKVAKLPETSVAEVISISEKIELLQKEISKKVNIALQDLIKSSQSKTEVIVTFLALLELVKQKVLSVQQQELFADIIIKKNET